MMAEEFICPVCGGTSFNWYNATLDGETARIEICNDCSTIFQDMTKATETAIRLQKERESEIARAVEAAIEDHLHRAHQRDDY